MHANAVTRSEIPNIRSDFFDTTRYFVPESQREIIEARNAGAIMRVRMTYASGGNANQNILAANFRDWNVFIFQRLTDLNELYCSHQPSLSLVTGHLSLLFVLERLSDCVSRTHLTQTN